MGQGTGPNGKADTFITKTHSIGQYPNTERTTGQDRKRCLILTMLIGREVEIAPNLNRAHWTVTFRIRCTSSTVVPVPTSSSAEQQHSSSSTAPAQHQHSTSTAPAAAADRVVKAPDEVRFKTPRWRSSVRRIPTAHQPTSETK